MSVLFQYILNELGELDSQEQQNLNELKLYKVFKRSEEDWTVTVKSALDLSSTIDIAIWHLWIKNSNIAKQQNIEYTKADFALDFIDNYYAEDSKVDVWTAEQLKSAEELIKNYQNGL